MSNVVSAVFMSAPNSLHAILMLTPKPKAVKYTPIAVPKAAPLVARTMLSPTAFVKVAADTSVQMVCSLA